MVLLFSIWCTTLNTPLSSCNRASKICAFCSQELRSAACRLSGKSICWIDSSKLRLSRCSYASVMSRWSSQWVAKTSLSEQLSDNLQRMYNIIQQRRNTSKLISESPLSAFKFVEFKSTGISRTENRQNLKSLILALACWATSLLIWILYTLICNKDFSVIPLETRSAHF